MKKNNKNRSIVGLAMALMLSFTVTACGTHRDVPDAETTIETSTEEETTEEVTEEETENASTWDIDEYMKAVNAKYSSETKEETKPQTSLSQDVIIDCTNATQELLEHYIDDYYFEPAIYDKFMVAKFDDKGAVMVTTNELTTQSGQPIDATVVLTYEPTDKSYHTITHYVGINGEVYEDDGYATKFFETMKEILALAGTK